jgi:copper(I)-binding protein
MAVPSKILRVAAIGPLALFLCAAPVQAGGIEVKSPWTRATVFGASVAAGFLTIEDKGDQPDRLTGASSDIAQKVEIHEMSMDGGVMKMRALPDGLEIKPGESVTLKPGGAHLMMFGLKEKLVPGAKVHVTLNFAKAGPIPVELPVQNIGATSPAPAAESQPTQPGY